MEEKNYILFVILKLKKTCLYILYTHLKIWISNIFSNPIYFKIPNIMFYITSICMYIHKRLFKTY